MALFNFRTPSPEEAAAIRFVDEDGDYSLGELLNALWIRVAGREPGPDWPRWYHLVSRFTGYARLDADNATRQLVVSWPACLLASCAGSHVFRDETGEIGLTQLVETIAASSTTNPTLARRLTRTIIRIAEVDRQRDCVARSLLDRAGLLADDVETDPANNK